MERSSGNGGNKRNGGISPGGAKVTSPAVLKELFRSRGLQPRRSMGQHFLIDENILHKIINAAALQEEDFVLDIGAGAGAISLAVAAKVAAVVAVEWDRGLAGLLEEQARARGLLNLRVVRGDVRRLDLGKICRESWQSIATSREGAGGAGSADSPGSAESAEEESAPRAAQQAPGAPGAAAAPGPTGPEGGDRPHAAMPPVKVAANLPYYLTTPLLFKLLQGTLPLKQLVIMVQLEVARRILAFPGVKDYGVLSILCRYYTEPHFLFKVSRGVFYPRPAVDSAVVLLDVLPERPVNVKSEKLMWSLVSAAFQKRRKTILNALQKVEGLGKEEWERLLVSAGISPGCRGETLALNEFANLSNMLYNEKGVFGFCQQVQKREKEG